ncbi:hypothetical protein TTHERM_000692979 (macronuclear) [Tetrahymena thermophila SB210]|uniref:Uncharacterized protein n=1 Tax=Tetrahymena thermophila (strain SB210) TaxID=312017 RepID=W7XE15_TETTS|nr:hypothetical protein TTHERM_000692979 [Tetrahymena thermophila SB210]EWS72176.1 hypothetical protein TTHERM_000692979 [Tetrahymena thermophila SB210]|eukprot:XP_012655307.1 hypothetical protein TTHERM_000692979 [Tetrahymena thermophila SB210]
METQQYLFKKMCSKINFHLRNLYPKFFKQRKSTAHVDMQCQKITQKNQKVKTSKDFFFKKHAEIIFKNIFFYGTKSFSKILQKNYKIVKHFKQTNSYFQKNLLTLIKNNQYTYFQKNQLTLIKRQLQKYLCLQKPIINLILIASSLLQCFLGNVSCVQVFVYLLKSSSQLAQKKRRSS